MSATDWQPLSTWPDCDPVLPSRDALRQRTFRMVRQGLPVPWARRVGRFYYVSRSRWLEWIDSREIPGSAHRAA